MLWSGSCASSFVKKMPRIIFKVVEAFNVKGHGVILVGDRSFSDFLGIKSCEVEIITPNGDVLQGVAFKEWLLGSSTPQPNGINAFFIRGMKESDIPIGSMVRVKQE
jgi:hypothetical protein